MRLLQHFTNLHGNSHGPRCGKATLASQCFRKRLAFDKLHDDEVTSVLEIAGVEDHGRVSVSQFGHSSRFTQETIGAVAITSKFRLDDLYRDGRLESEMNCAIYSSHAAGSDFALDPEPAGDKLRDIHIRPSFGLKGRSKR